MYLWNIGALCGIPVLTPHYLI